MFFSDDRISAIVQLGQFLRDYTQKKPVSPALEDLVSALDGAVALSHSHNGWFTPENIQFALSSWGDALTVDNLEQWREMEGGTRPVNRTRVGLVMAGNIPLVGFHDFLTTFLAGHFALIKLSSDDQYLLPVLLKVIVRQDALFEGDFMVVDRLDDMSAVIATGSDNTSRYFEYYFGKYPNIIRKNRTSVAVLTGQEEDAELHALGEDIFRYFGLGCRNISHVLVPQDFDIQRLFANIFAYGDVVNNNKYGNNFDYYRAIYLMNQDDFLENGFLIIRENEILHTPVSILHYSRYSNPQELENKLAEWADQLQCVVGKNHIPFGKSQTPELWDYADGVNTMQFLAHL